MKDLIVIVGTLILGLLIFSLIIGDEDSLKAVSQKEINKVLTLYQDEI